MALSPIGRRVKSGVDLLPLIPVSLLFFFLITVTLTLMGLEVLFPRSKMLVTGGRARVLLNCQVSYCLVILNSWCKNTSKLEKESKISVEIICSDHWEQVEFFIQWKQGRRTFITSRSFEVSPNTYLSYIDYKWTSPIATTWESHGI